MFDNLLIQLAGLAGFAALFTLIINVLKSVGVVKDDTAPVWSAGFNIAGLVALYVLGIVKPGFSVGGVDVEVSGFVAAITPIVNWVIMMASSKVAHNAVRGVPWLGKSNSRG
jgi:hypothetical protein